MKILDCTLRDGGYVNGWQFLDDDIQNIIFSLEKSNVDIVELGYLDKKSLDDINTTKFKDMRLIDKFIKNSKNIQKVVMINFGDYDVNELSTCKSNFIDGIRLAFHKKDLDKALLDAKTISDLGYKLYLQPMITKNYTDIEFLHLIEKANGINPYAFYIVDSFGSMSLKEFQRYMILADNNLRKDILLGYHSHNNMQLAFSNAINMCNTNLDREIIIDSSIYGIGRGAGNLNTELIIDFLNDNFSKNYNTIPLLEVIDSLLSSLKEQNSWGFSPAQYLSALFNCHPNYVTYLTDKGTTHIVKIKQILEQIKEKDKTSFNLTLIESLYQQHLLSKKIDILKDENLILKENILLIASGQTIQDEKYKKLINEKKENGYTVVALNFKPDVECDYYFFSNQKRFDKFSNTILTKKIVVTNNIETDKDLNFVLDFKELSFVGGSFISNVAMIFINYLIKKGLKKVEIVGLDGYKADKLNYTYQDVSLNEQEIDERNKTIKEALEKLSKNIKIDILTPSVFSDFIRLKILGVIPARYKSTRFEGKPLCIIKNIPMIKRTYLQAKKSKLLDGLVVATDDEKIQKYCQEENIPFVITSSKCLTGTDRVAEVSKQKHYDLYVNIQGDEPVIDAQNIDMIVQEFKKYQESYIAYNLYKNIDDKDEVKSDTIIKTIVNEKDELMYMSRLPVPFSKSKKEPKFKKQVCVYGFTKKALEVFAIRDKTLNEQYEDIEILRFLDMGYKIKMKETIYDSIAVDVKDDIKKVEQYLDENGLV